MKVKTVIPDDILTNLLDWDELLLKINSFIFFQSNLDNLKSAPTVKEVHELRHIYDKVQLYQEAHSDSDVHLTRLFDHLPSESDRYSFINFIPKGRILTPKEIHLVCLLLEKFILIPEVQRNFPLLTEDRLYIPEHLKRSIQNFRKVIGPGGEINYSGHPELHTLYQKLLAIQEKIRVELSRVVRSSHFKNIIQHDQFDILEGHYVLVIRSDSYQGKLGRIISRSNSGQSLFIEPAEIRDLTLKRLELESSIARIIDSICREMTEFFINHSDCIFNARDALLEIDYFYSRARMAEFLCLKRPDISASPGVFNFKGLFHPLLEKPIPNDLELNQAKLGVIISGPNTGGKTVYLKSVALSIVMAHHGFFLPIKQGTFSLFSFVFYFGNDMQDLSQGLSSFASETLQYLKLVKQKPQNSIVIMDEIFNTTSSDEASVLAKSIIDGLVKSTNKIFLSTHHRLLKILFQSDDRFLSAHMLFDVEKSLPLFKVSYDGPGSSFAFSIFKNIIRNEFSDDSVFSSILESANLLFVDKNFNYELLLEELNNDKVRLDKLIRDNEELQINLKNQKKAMEGILYLEKQRLYEEYTSKIENLLKRASNLNESARQISTHKFIEDKRLIQSELSELALVEKKHERNPNLIDFDFKHVEVGESVIHTLTRQSGTILTLDKRKQRVQVLIGNLRIWTNCSELQLIRSSNKSSSKIKNVAITTLSELNTIDIDVDCRGIRLDEFQKIVSRQIDALHREVIPYTLIIHGHGDGVLKKWLRNFLKNEKSLSFVIADGNDGATEIRLKN